MVLFLEEDHFVTEDFVYMLQLAQAQASRQEFTFDAICIGSKDKYFDYQIDHNKVSILNFSIKL